MTVVESPKGRASHNLGNRGAIPTFPPPGYCYIFFQNLSRKESSSPPAPSLFRLILRLEKTHPQRLVVSQFGSEPNGRRVHRLSGRRKGFLSNHRCRPRVINIVLSGDVGVFPKFSDFPPRHSASPALEVTLSNRLKFESLRPRPVPKRLDFPPFSRPH